MKSKKKVYKYSFIDNETSSLKNDKKGIIHKKKKNKYFPNKNKRIKKECKCSFIYPILYLISYLLYFLSLEKCFEGEDVCCLKMKWMIKKLIELLISCLILSFSLELIIQKKSSKLHLIHILIVFVLFYKYSHSYYFYDHGYFNLVLYIFLLVLFMIMIFICKGFIFLIKRNIFYFDNN